MPMQGCNAVCCMSTSFVRSQDENRSALIDGSTCQVFVYCEAAAVGESVQGQPGGGVWGGWGGREGGGWGIIDAKG